MCKHHIALIQTQDYWIERIGNKLFISKEINKEFIKDLANEIIEAQKLIKQN